MVVINMEMPFALYTDRNYFPIHRHNPEICAPLEGFSERKFIIVAVYRGRIDNGQRLTSRKNSEWHFNNFAQTFPD
ncbi:MAG: hypothetical protein V4693_07465 [Pseudomonadota bacterium]